MENLDTTRKSKTIAQIIRVCGILFFIASGLNVLPWKYAVFAGIACFLIAPAVQQFIATRP
jgi:phosphatidylglycerophosphate synthase